jgi:hypothetical protein
MPIKEGLYPLLFINNLIMYSIGYGGYGQPYAYGYSSGYARVIYGPSYGGYGYGRNIGYGGYGRHGGYGGYGRGYGGYGGGC